MISRFRLACQEPFDWTGLLAFLAARAVEGIERVDERRYRRTIACDGEAGLLEVTHDAAGTVLVVSIAGLSPASARAARDRVRRMFDLDADLAAISSHLARDPALAALVVAQPAPRVLRGWDGFEVAARAVFGQQVSVEHARQLNGRLVARCGVPLRRGVDEGLDRLFPTPRQVVDADLTAMGMPGARVAALKHVAGAALADPSLFARGTSIEETVARLRAIRGIGDWTAHYIAMRACGEPDAFPASDVGLLRGAADTDRRRPTPAALLARAEAWRPWRAYAAHLLWARDPGRR